MTRFEKLILHGDPFSLAWEIDDMMLEDGSDELIDILKNNVMRTERLDEWLREEVAE